MLNSAAAWGSFIGDVGIHASASFLSALAPPPQYEGDPCPNWGELDLDAQVPDHSTFSVNRHGRFRDGDVLRGLFEAVVRACMDEGLIKGEGFAVHASVIEADASRYHGKAPDEIDWSLPECQTRAVAEFLGAPDDEDPDTDRKLRRLPCRAGVIAAPAVVIGGADEKPACVRG